MFNLRVKLLFSLHRHARNYFRSSRMKKFCELIGGIEAGTRVVDLGGQPQIWDSVAVPLHITIVNLPGTEIEEYDSIHTIDYIEGDACSLGMFDDNQFDISFSNSVIEHVGDESRMRMFANESSRIAARYWIQTPSKYFPLEPHTGMPFWWFYPQSLKRYFLGRWERDMPLIAMHAKRTTFITRRQLLGLYPDASIFTERFCGFAKSYSAYRAGQSDA